MIFTIIIRSSHLDNNHSALTLANELLQQQHSINCIYFLFDGAYTANKSIDMPTDEVNLNQAWSELAINNNIDLIICAASGLRRGISATNIAPGFKIGSIGQLVECCDQADRVVSL